MTVINQYQTWVEQNHCNMPCHITFTSTAATRVVHDNKIQNCGKEHQHIRGQNCPPHEQLSKIGLMATRIIKRNRIWMEGSEEKTMNITLVGSKGRVVKSPIAQIIGGAIPVPVTRLRVISIQCLCASKSPYLGGFPAPEPRKLYPKKMWKQIQALKESRKQNWKRVFEKITLVDR
ncbi:hypothetical protein LOK49_LG01G01971 [Camellia lanceoleosa]|uniref:Uncharacterized protein n=1 Tax=Camellia lanceoleosa TaxID=1840588 RepID=A0ACC0IW29_9ERIC|nr:hypothetical protein LOK49_LG01G01971 [Camellia lanceoleosa]